MKKREKREEGKEGKPREGGGKSPPPPFQNSHGGEMKGSHRGRGVWLGEGKGSLAEERAKGGGEWLIG